MTQPIYEHHSDPSCSDHPHCPFCGGLLVEDAERVVCVNCRAEAPVGVEVHTEAVAS